MFDYQNFYENMSDDELKILLRCYTDNRDHYINILHDNIGNDIGIITRILRQRGLARIDLRVKFPLIVEQLDQMNTPKELYSLLIDCETDRQAIIVLEQVQRFHSVDPLWEENWLE